MDEYEINIVDGRNADHRTQTVRPGGVAGGSRVPVRTLYTQPSAQPQMAYGPPTYYGPQGQPWGSNLLARVTPGVVIDMVAQIFAALMPLPAAPVATSEVGTDVQNLITYQSAIASYAKRDEQVRTLGNLIVKLIG
jgi:hypothetical protein